MENNKLNNSEEKVRLTANILFSGIGAQERGFRNSNLFDMDVLVTSDISKEATLSYAAIHCGLTNEMVDTYENYPSREEMAQYFTDINLGYDPEKNKKYDWFKLAKRKKNDIEKYWLATKLSNNLGDISLIDELPYADFWSISFCCQDISVAGKMKGLKPDSGTRSSLLWDNIKLLEKARENNELPKYVMFENVKNLVSKKFINDFNDLIDVMGELGFNTYWKVLNGKECGIAQNRERVFVICIRKDIDTGLFEFPVPFDNGLRLRDFLEDSVDEKYYLSDEKVKGVINFPNSECTGLLKNQGNEFSKETEYANTLLARDWKGFGNQEMNAVCELEQIGYINNYNGDANRIYSDKCCRTLKSEAGGGGAKKGWYKIRKRIRKLTERECARLMGFTDEDNDKCATVGVASTHLYKNYGNSIITNCVELIAEHLYKAQYDNTYVCFDENFTQPQVER